MIIVIEKPFFKKVWLDPWVTTALNFDLTLTFFSTAQTSPYKHCDSSF